MTAQCGSNGGEPFRIDDPTVTLPRMAGGERLGLDLDPHDHVVHFFDAEEALVAGVTAALSAAAARGEGIVVIASDGRLPAIADGLVAAGVNVGSRTADGSLTLFDAAETLAALMIEGTLDPDRFADIVGGAVAAAGAGNRRVSAFGDMVSILWAKGNPGAAIQLEALWNSLATHHDFSLYCAYPLSAAAAGDLDEVAKVCRHHSGVLAPQHYPDAARPDALEELTEDSTVFLPVPSVLRSVRQFVTDHLTAWGAATFADDASLVVSELATNAVIHARSPFLVTVGRDAKTVRIAVQDRGDGAPILNQAGPLDPGGRGVAIVDRISTRWGIDWLARGKIVWSELALSSPLTASA